MSENDVNMIKAIMPKAPEWEVLMMADKDPRAEGVKWLLEHGFLPLMLEVPDPRNINVWFRDFGMWRSNSSDATDDPAWYDAVRLHVTMFDHGCVAGLNTHVSLPPVYERKKYNVVGDSPKEAIDRLANQIPLVDLIKKAIGDNK